MNAITPNKRNDRNDRDDRRGGMYNKYSDNKNKNKDGDWITPTPSKGRSAPAYDISKVKTSMSDASQQRLGPSFAFNSFINTNTANKFAGLTDDEPHQETLNLGSNRQLDLYGSDRNKFGGMSSGGGSSYANTARNLNRQNSRENSRQRPSEIKGPSRSFQDTSRPNTVSQRDRNDAVPVGHSLSQIVGRHSQQKAVDKPQQQPAKKYSESDEPVDTDLERYRNFLKLIIEENLTDESLKNFDTNEFQQKIKREYRWVAVRELFYLGLEKDDKWRLKIVDIIYELLSKNDAGLLTVDDFKLAAKVYLSVYADFIYDYPKLAQYTSQYFNKMLQHNYLSFKDIHEYSETLIADDCGGKYLVEQFKLLQSSYGPKRVRELWSNSKLQLGSFLKNPADVDKFVKSNVSHYLLPTFLI